MSQSYPTASVLHMLFDSLGNGLGLLLLKEFIGDALGRHPHTDFKVTKLSPCPNQRQSHKTWHYKYEPSHTIFQTTITRKCNAKSMNQYANSFFFRMPLSLVLARRLELRQLLPGEGLPSQFAAVHVQQKQLMPTYFFIPLLGTNISHPKALLKMMFLFPTWDMLVTWRVY